MEKKEYWCFHCQKCHPLSLEEIMMCPSSKEELLTDLLTHYLWTDFPFYNEEMDSIEDTEGAILLDLLTGGK